MRRLTTEELIWIAIVCLLGCIIYVVTCGVLLADTERVDSSGGLVEYHIYEKTYMPYFIVKYEVNCEWYIGEEQRIRIFYVNETMYDAMELDHTYEIKYKRGFLVSPDKIMVLNDVTLEGANRESPYMIVPPPNNE